MTKKVTNNQIREENKLLVNNSTSAEAVWRVTDAMRGIIAHPTDEQAYLCAYLASVIKSSDAPYTSPSAALGDAAGDDPLIRKSLEAVLSSVRGERFLSTVEKVSTDDLNAYLLAGPAMDYPLSSECSTPQGVASLVFEILNVRPGDRIVDFGSGIGTFLELAARACDGTQLIGVEHNSNCVAAARVRAKISGSAVAYECDDMFAYYERVLAADKVDRVFSNYPWGMRAKYLKGKSTYLEKVLKGMSEYGRPASADWVFNRLLVDSIREDGVAVGIMTNGSAFNGADTRVRKYFIENGWIRAAVSLPAGVFSPWTNIATTLVVLGHGNKDGIRLVDATDIGTRERRGVTFSESDVRTILSRLSEDSDRSILVSVAELAEREYTLSASRLLQKEIRLVNPIAMKDLILEVTRGAGLRAKELDELACVEDTGVHYLNLANIIDGSIDGELPCLKELDPKLEKCCLRTGDLLLSKNGAPYKIAVAEVPGDQKILANGNLYIIRLDTEKVDPYYLAAFLNSPDGKELLARASKGSVIPNLPLGELRAMRVPLESAERQRRIAAAYQAKLDEIGVLKLRLSRARQELVDLFDKEA